jgi:hypothetical protein
MDIAWNERMHFDGRTAQFEGDVQGKSEDATLSTALLKVVLQRRVDFANPDARQRPGVEHVECHGGVILHSRSKDERGKLASIDHLTTRDLTIHQISGEIKARGPGMLESVRIGSPLVQPLAAAPANPPADEDQLNYLNLKFQHGINGNQLNRQLTFSDQVHAIYGPVEDWDAKLDPDTTDLPPGAMLLECDELTVTQMAPGADNRGPLELDATGNTVVEGASPQGEIFVARAHQLTYAQAKDLLILHGNGRSKAELYRQAQAGQPPIRVPADTIHFWPTARKMETNGMGPIDGPLPLDIDEMFRRRRP